MLILKAYDVSLKTIDEFPYLGGIITSDGATTIDIPRRIKKARGIFSKMSDAQKTWRWRQKLISNSTIKPVLLYGSET